ncbi:peptide deformylase [Kribbella sp. NPDC055071]
MRTLIQGRPARNLPAMIDEVRRGTPRRITEYGEEILHRACRPVSEFGADRWAGLIDDLFATLWVADGCGLAANQIDVDAQVFVYDLTDDFGTRHLGHAINPTITTAAAFFGDQDGTEGCLSVPGVYAPLARPARVTLHAQDLDGRPFTVEATDYLARCLLHETQHLQGQVYVDHLSPAARDRALTTSTRERATVMKRRATRARQLTGLTA